MTHNPYNLQRFLVAQDRNGTYDAAVSELRQGLKTSHWMWFIFPQLTGLGRSRTAQHYAISSLAEARAFLTHPVLGTRLVICARILGETRQPDVEQIFGPVDAQKLRSCMTLFVRADPSTEEFQAVLDRYFGGVPDQLTLRLIDSPHP